MTNAVVAGAMLVLTLAGCGGKDRGKRGDLSVEFVTSAEATTCPVLTGITALPTSVFVGHRLELRAGLTSTEGARFEWTGRGGSFWSPRAAETSFHCLEAGSHELKVTLTKEGCPIDRKSVTVLCTWTDGGVEY